MTENVRLTERQQRAVLAVLAHPRLSDAAHAAGVSDRTLRRWRAAPPFARAVRDAARDADRAAVDSLRAAQVDAVRVLREALTDESSGVRVNAAVALLKAGERARGDDTDARLTALEERTSRWRA